MSAKLNEYSQILVARYEARDSGDFDQEDRLLDALDRLWLTMSESERDSSRGVARTTKAQFNVRKAAIRTKFEVVHFVPRFLPGTIVATLSHLDGGPEPFVTKVVDKNAHSGWQHPEVAYG